MTKKDSVLQLKTPSEEKYISESTKRMTMPEEVFPEYFLLLVSHFNEMARTPIEEWMEYLKDGAIRDDTTTPGLQAARKKLAIMSMTEKERREYRDFMVSVHAAKDNWDTMRDEARAEGLAEGRAEGERNKAMETARRMKAKGYPLEDIAEISGLTVEAINRL